MCHAIPSRIAAWRTDSRRFSKRPSLSVIGQYLLVWGIPVRGGIATACDAASRACGLPGGSRVAPWHAHERGQVRPMDYGTTTDQTTGAFGTADVDTDPAAPAAGSHRQPRVLGRHAPGWWPLVAVLIVQAALSIRLLRADTAFEDEATYLWAGHLEWAHWLHGVPLPQFPAYFSGAPVLYPPIGALADSIGGLTGARVLSLIFMLVATTFLWGTVSKLYGNRAAFFAAALFAVSGPTLHLGAFATYDAMSVFLVTLAAWLVVRPGEWRDAPVWMIAAGVTLALADATAYTYALFDLVVLLLALVTALPKPGGRLAAMRPLTILAVGGVLVLAALLLGGSRYYHGIGQTTIFRTVGSDSAF